MPGLPELQLIRTSADYVSDFHSVVTRRYVIMLRGRREYEVADGKKLSVGAGSIMLVEDLSGRGHLTRGAGEEALNLLIALPDQK